MLQQKSNLASDSTTESSRILGLKELYAIAIGTVIGAGIVTILGSAIQVTGISAWLAYAIAIVVGFIVVIPFVIISGIVRLQGGFYSMTLGLLGERWGGMFIMCYIPNAFTYSLYGLSLGIYANSMIPALDKKLVGVCAVIIVYLINLAGVKGMAKLQKIMTWTLIGSLIVFIIMGMSKITTSPFDFHNPDFFTNGSIGFIDAIILLVYSTTSYYLTVNFAGAAKDSKKHIPLVLCTMPIILFIFYCGAAIVASCVLPIAEVAGKPLTYVAKAVMPSWMLYVFILGGACMALGTTLNGTFASFGRMYAQGCKDGWFPDSISKLNKNDQPIVLYTISAIIGIIPILIGFNVKTITNNTVLLTYICNLIPMIAVLYLPTKYPEAWKASRFHMPLPLFYTIVGISIITKIAVMILSASNLTTTAIIVSLIAIGTGFAYAMYRYKNGKTHCKEVSFNFED